MGTPVLCDPTHIPQHCNQWPVCASNGYVSGFWQMTSEHAQKVKWIAGQEETTHLSFSTTLRGKIGYQHLTWYSTGSIEGIQACLKMQDGERSAKKVYL